MSLILNKRIICVDDEKAILSAYRRILAMADDDVFSEILTPEEQAGNETSHSYDLYLASSGEEALTIIEAELLNGYHMAAAFIDMRMPGGIDGYETMAKMRQLDPNLICVIVSAQTDHSIIQMRELFPKEKQDELLFFRKPFSQAGIEQTALNVVHSWNRKRNEEKHLQIIKENQENLASTVKRLEVAFQEANEANLATQKSMKELQDANKIIGQQNVQLANMATRDGLTGLFNHRHFQEILEKRFALAKRHDNDLCLLIIDLDYFKDVNDTFGHAFGDFVLKEFAELLRNEMRDTDIVARYGGEEFTVLLPNTDMNGGRVLGQKIREKAANHLYEDSSHSKRITISIGGVSIKSQNPQSENDMIKFADLALYQAKAQGRNQMIMYSRIAKAGREIVTRGDKSVDDLEHFRECFKSALEKSRKAVMLSFETFVQDLTTPHPLLSKRNIYSTKIIDSLGEQMGLPKSIIQTFKRTSRLHDMFRLFIGDISVKKCGPLDAQERSDIENQPFMLEELTHLFDFFSNEREILLCHHENYDGSGYPQKLAGNEIPMGARIFSVIDAFVAMTTPNISRAALPPDKVRYELESQAGRQFDPMVVKLLLNAIDSQGLLKTDSCPEAEEPS